MERKNRTISVCLMAIAAFLLPLTAWAGRVSEAEALQRAKAFVAGRGVQAPLQQEMRLAVKGRRAMARSQENDYYVFNVGDDAGFVVVSGDDRTVDILGYADSGRLHEGSMPDGLRYLLDGYAEQIAWLEENEIEGEGTQGQRRNTPARSAIAPLIATRWNQGAPYNNKCPELLLDKDNSEAGKERAVTGCVATSMAQLMYYHHWPETGDYCTTIPTYTYSAKDKNKASYSKTINGLDPTTFSWNNMTLTYTNTSTTTADAAVATLMAYCGVSLQMMYGLSANGGSSAYSEAIPEALKTYFGYDGGVRHTYRKNYSYDEWVSLIYSELASHRPVALGGQSMGGGHSFVCDGYDTDDYFHINWGWGGSSDGYFRLSVLQPWEQGIGGSSTLDGFSYSQDAVIGIQPPVDGNKDYCLSLEDLRLASPSTASSATFDRDGTGAFTGISLYYVVYCYKYGENYFDYGLQLVDGSDKVVHTFNTATQKMIWNQTNTYKTLSDLTVPSNIDDGTYYIKVMSRPQGAAGWQECFDGDRYQLTAVISGDQLTINVPIAAQVLPADATITVTTDRESDGYLKQGYEQQVTASITGGAADYYGDIFLGVNGKAIMGKTVDIPAGMTVDAHFSFIPTSTGTYTLSLYNGRDRDKNVSGTHIGENTTVTIDESDATNTQTLNFEEPTIENLKDGKLYGNAVRVTATVSNPSGENSYVGTVNCSLREYDDKEADNFVSIYVSKPISIGKSSSKDILFEYDGLKLGKFYRLRFSYEQGYEEGGEQKKRTVDLEPTDFYEMGEGYLAYNADGSNTILPKPDGTIDAGDALCLDLTSLSTLPSVEPSTNPNCVYLLASGASAPASLSGCNVVIGDVASTLTLTDGNDFYTPVAFTATNASYTRTFTLAAKGTSGWNTLFLPFDVTTVTCGDDNKPVDWFHSATDEGKNFWVRAFAADGESFVTFDYAQTIAANTPYIIAVPDDYWGTEWEMTGKPVTFSGSNASIAATQSVGVSGNHYKFVGSTVAGSLSDVYLLNSAGSKFVKAASATAVPAFRGWFDAVSISSLSRTSLSILSPEASGISTVSSDNTAAGGADHWYTLDGCRLDSKPTAKGIYIHKGKKLIIR